MPDAVGDSSKRDTGIEPVADRPAATRDLLTPARKPGYCGPTDLSDAAAAGADRSDGAEEPGLRERVEFPDDWHRSPSQNTSEHDCADDDLTPAATATKVYFAYLLLLRMLLVYYTHLPSAAVTATLDGVRQTPGASRGSTPACRSRECRPSVHRSRTEDAW